MADQEPPSTQGPPGTTVYTGWEREGSPPAGHPQPGDLVVVLDVWPSDRRPPETVVASLCGVLQVHDLDETCQGDLTWHVVGRSGRAWWVHAVRRPTEAELAAHYLEHGGANG